MNGKTPEQQNNSTQFPYIPGYRIERKLGEGGMATVYLAHEEKLDRLVALKVLTLLSEEGRPLAERFIKEARTAGKLRNSGIVSVFDVGSQGHVYYMAIEYLEGGSLKERIAAGPIPPAEAMDILGKVAGALHYAHSQGLIHRDIKPDNIMFRQDGFPVLTDFGIARAVDSHTHLTKTGMSIGTPHYMSPEQGRGETLDGRSDLYSLGAVFYEMLTGKLPYNAENTIGVIIQHIQSPIPELPSHLSQYQSLLNKMLAKDPQDRFQTGAELVDTLNSSDVGALLARARTSKSKSRIPNPGSPDQPASSGDYANSRRSKVEGQKSKVKIGFSLSDHGSRITGHDPHPNPESRIPFPPVTLQNTPGW